MEFREGMDARKFLVGLVIAVILIVLIVNRIKYARINRWITDARDLVRDTASFYYINDLYISDGRHYEHLLDKKEKKLFEDVYEAIKNRQSTVVLDLNEFEYSNFTRAVVVDTAFEKVFDVLSMDHPELIYYSPASNMFTYQRDSKYITVYLEYSMDNETYLANMQRMQNVITVLKDATKEMSEYEKCKFVYEWLGTTNVYGAIDGSLSHSAYSAFVADQPTVCEGYAKAAQIILQNIGVNSIYVDGRLRGGKHAWNLVKIEGKYYYFDATSTSSFKDTIADPICYAGFLPMNVKSYKFDYKQIIPEIKGKKYLYYRYNNLEIKFSDDSATYEKIKAIADSREGNSVIEFRVKNMRSLKKHMQELEQLLGARSYFLYGIDDTVFFVP
ncbi:MAG: hypothetical protein IJ867_04370 [Clostridia bacterium]|nr:hypothetical protein [Clostridia bacterium]